MELEEFVELLPELIGITMEVLGIWNWLELEEFIGINSGIVIGT